jgi:hypothetical protein
MLVLLFTFPLAAALSAQTKISGELQCAKPDPKHVIAIGDRPGHTFSIGKSQCKYTKTYEIEGISPVTEESSYMREVTGDKARGRGAGVVAMTNGDKLYVYAQSVATLRNGSLQSAEVTWTINGGTGKMKGAKGKGTTKITESPDGARVAVFEGELQIVK